MHQSIDDGGLAGAVGTQKRNDLTFLHMKADPLHGLDGAVVDHKIFNSEKRHLTPPFPDRLPYLYPYIEKYVDEIVTVTEENIMKAIKIGCLYGKLTMEGAAALPLAAILEGKCARTDNTVLICSGGNIDQTLFEKCLAVEL